MALEVIENESFVQERKIQIPQIIIPTNRKLRVIFDHDDVLNTFNYHLIEIINHIEGTNYTIEDITDWNITKLFGLNHPIEYYIQQDKDFFFNLLPKGNNMEIFEEMYKSDKYDMFIGTYVNMVFLKFWTDKLRWFEKYAPYFPIDRIIPIREKNAMWGDYLIDDGPHNIKSFDLGKGIIYDMPYNRQLEGDRIYNLQEFKEKYL